MKRVLAWKENSEGRGLLLAGPSRAGKTRSVWLLLHRLFVEEAVSFVALTDTGFAHECSFRFANPTNGEWIERLCAARILFMDGLGAAVATERYRHELGHVIEQRTAWQRPLFVTTHLDSEALAARIGGMAGVSIVKRLYEFCDVVPFAPLRAFEPTNRKEL